MNGFRVGVSPGSWKMLVMTMNPEFTACCRLYAAFSCPFIVRLAVAVTVAAFMQLPFILLQLFQGGPQILDVLLQLCLPVAAPVYGLQPLPSRRYM